MSFDGVVSPVAARRPPKSNFVLMATLGVLLILGLVLRFVGLNNPPMERHGFRQSQTLSTIETYYRDGIDLLHPRTIYKGDPGVFVLEFPLFQAGTAILYNILGPHIEIVRLLNIILGALTTWLLFLIVNRLFDLLIAWAAAVIYWLAPLNIYYQRSVLLDPLGVLLALLVLHEAILLFKGRQSVAAQGKPHWEKIHWVLFASAVLLTAMIKALYLWPTLVWMCVNFLLRDRKIDAKLVGAIVVFAIAGACFLTWNSYATRINDLSLFTKGTSPTSLLGLSDLFMFDYHRELALRAKWWLGFMGLFLLPVGYFFIFCKGSQLLRYPDHLAMGLLPPSYLILFAHINHPHEYYQLIITPFFATVAALGVSWFSGLGKNYSLGNGKGVIGWICFWVALICLVAIGIMFCTQGHAHQAGSLTILLFPPMYLMLLGIGYVKSGSGFPLTAIRMNLLMVFCAALIAISSAATYLVWFGGPKVEPETLTFANLCLGKVRPGGRAMVFIRNLAYGDKTQLDLPHYLYAAKLWGIGKTVHDSAEAHSCYNESASEFHTLEYLVFYGTDYPNWVSKYGFRNTVSDSARKFYLFQKLSI